MNQTPILTAVAGIGGFGSAHHAYLHQLEKEGLVKVVATCDPRVETLGAVMEKEEFARRGIAAYADFETMLAAHGENLGLVTVAAPIGLHAPMHRACVERGIACYLEKPPTLDPEELEAMIAADETARFRTQVGFNYIYQPERIELKRRILSGEFGKLRRVISDALWPRSLGYFSRNNWAGRLFLGDSILLDSCCGNAISHHLQNILYFGGTDSLEATASPARVEAELYRAHPIEGTDTVFARGVLESGVEFRIANSHAVEPGQHVTREWLICDKAEILIRINTGIIIRHEGGAVEEIPVGYPGLDDNFRLYIDYIRGERPRPVTLLSDCRGFVRLNALLYLASKRITTVEPPFMVEMTHNENTTCCISGIDSALAAMVAEGALPSEQKVPWSAPGGSATPEELGSPRETLRRIQAEGTVPSA